MKGNMEYYIPMEYYIHGLDYERFQWKHGNYYK